MSSFCPLVHICICLCSAFLGSFLFNTIGSSPAGSISKKSKVREINTVTESTASQAHKLYYIDRALQRNAKIFHEMIYVVDQHQITNHEYNAAQI